MHACAPQGEGGEVAHRKSIAPAQRKGMVRGGKMYGLSWPHAPICTAASSGVSGGVIGGGVCGGSGGGEGRGLAGGSAGGGDGGEMGAHRMPPTVAHARTACTHVHRA